MKNDRWNEEGSVVVNRVLPERMEIAKSHWVHEEFFKTEDLFRTAFPELRSL